MSEQGNYTEPGVPRQAAESIVLQFLRHELATQPAAAPARRALQAYKERKRKPCRNNPPDYFKIPYYVVREHEPGECGNCENCQRSRQRTEFRATERLAAIPHLARMCELDIVSAAQAQRGKPRNAVVHDIAHLVYLAYGWSNADLISAAYLNLCDFRFQESLIHRMVDRVMSQMS